MEPSKIAFFDVDGTIIDTQSQRLFLQFARKRGLIKFWPYVKTLSWFLLYKLGFGKNAEIISAYAYKQLASWDELEARKVFDIFFDQIIQPRIFPEIIDLVKEHQTQGHFVVLVSNSLKEIITRLGQYLDIDSKYCLAKEMEFEGGKFTGRLKGNVIYSLNKVGLVKSWLAQNDLICSESWGYSDHHSDLDLLEWVNHPAAVNPEPVLAKIAAERHWPIKCFNLD